MLYFSACHLLCVAQLEMKRDVKYLKDAFAMFKDVWDTSFRNVIDLMLSVVLCGLNSSVHDGDDATSY